MKKHLGMHLLNDSSWKSWYGRKAGIVHAVNITQHGIYFG